VRFRKNLFYIEEFLVPFPTPKLENITLSTVHNYLFSIFAATLHISISGGRLVHPDPENAPCRDDRNSNNMGCKLCLTA